MIENRVAAVMKDRGVNVSQLATGAGISYHAAHGLYTGASKRVDLPVLARVCRFLEASVGELLVYVPTSH